MLNLDYLQNLPRDVPLYDLIENNRLAAFLRQQGYRFAFFLIGFRVTFQNRNADLQLPPAEGGPERVRCSLAEHHHVAGAAERGVRVGWV